MEAVTLDLNEFQAKWEPLSAILQHPKNEEEYDQLVAHMETLLDEVGEEQNHALAGALQIVSDICLAYEAEHHQIDTSGLTAESMLAFLMEQQSMTQKELEATGFDNQGNISRLLKGKTQMNRKHIEKACNIFRVSADLFFPAN